MEIAPVLTSWDTGLAAHNSVSVFQLYCFIAQLHLIDSFVYITLWTDVIGFDLFELVWSRLLFKNDLF